jgi:hypothetical protein
MTLVYVCVGARVWQCGTKVCGGERVCVWVGAGVYYVFVGVILTYVLREGGGLKGVPGRLCPWQSVSGMPSSA